MSRYVHVFVGSSSTLDAFTIELGSTLSVGFRRIEDGDITRYIHIGREITLTVYAHDLVNDRDMSFEEFTFAIDISAGHIRDAKQRARRQADVAQDVFQKLKGHGKHRLMLVDDLQKKIDEYSPKVA